MTAAAEDKPLTQAERAMQPAVLPTAPNAAWNLLEAVVSAAPEGGVRLQGPLVPPSFLGEVPHNRALACEFIATQTSML